MSGAVPHALRRSLHAAAVLVTAASLSSAAPARSGDLAEEAFAVLRERCATCHAPEAEDRKAVRAWKDALDVAATIDLDILVPGAPEDSELWEVVESGDMPPEDADSGPLTDTERETLRRWIAEGALVPQEPAPDDAAGSAQDGEPERAAPEDGAWRWTRLAPLHPLVVHFPIGLLLAAVGAELLVGLGARGLRTASRFCTWIGLLGAGAAIASGWFLAETTTPRELVETHRWLGVGSAAAAFALALSLEARARGRGSRFLHVLLVLAVGIVVSLAGHWGGMATWGRDALDELIRLPDFLR